MADELQFYGLIAQTGLTVVARVYTDAGAQVGSDITCAEVGTDAIYIGDMPATGAGTYAVRFVSSGEVVGSGCIEWDGAQEITGRDIIAETQQSEADVIAALPSVAGLATSAEIAALNDISVADIEASAALTAVADVSGLATAASIAALNDFNPASDTVARVTLVDTTTTNTDMRGTDGATTSAGDATAATQTAILSAIAALNDLSAADVTGAVPTTAQIEAALLNEGDGQQLIDAIVQAIGNINTDEIALIAAVRADLERTGGMLDLVETKAEADARQVALIAEHDATQAGLGSGGVDLTKLDELHAIHGLDIANPMTVTPASRAAGTITQAITGDGEATTTVTRT